MEASSLQNSMKKPEIKYSKQYFSTLFQRSDVLEVTEEALWLMYTEFNRMRIFYEQKIKQFYCKTLVAGEKRQFAFSQFVYLLSSLLRISTSNTIRTQCSDDSNLFFLVSQKCPQYFDSFSRTNTPINLKVENCADSMYMPHEAMSFLIRQDQVEKRIFEFSGPDFEVLFASF